MAESILPGAIHRETEFVRGLTGACGRNALAMESCWSRQGGAPDTAGVYSFMRAKGLCEASGACTIEQLHQAAQLLGFTLPEVRAYGEHWADWRNFFLRHAGQHYQNFRLWAPAFRHGVQAGSPAGDDSTHCLILTHPKRHN